MGLIVDVKVVPSAGKQQWVLDKKGALKCFLKSPPERGLANAELIKSLAKALGITQQEVALVAGHSSRNKRVKIDRALTFEQLLALLGIERQSSLL